MNKACANSFEYSWTCRRETSSRWANSQKRSNNTNHVKHNGEYKIYNSQKLDFLIAKSERSSWFRPPVRVDALHGTENGSGSPCYERLIIQSREKLSMMSWTERGRCSVRLMTARTPPPYLPVFPFHFPLPVESLRYDSHNPGLTPSSPVLDDSFSLLKSNSMGLGVDTYNVERSGCGATKLN